MTAQEHNHDLQFVFEYFGHAKAFKRCRVALCVNDKQVAHFVKNNENWVSIEEWVTHAFAVGSQEWEKV